MKMSCDFFVQILNINRRSLVSAVIKYLFVICVVLPICAFS